MSTYSLPFLYWLALIFLLDLMGPCFRQHFGVGGDMGVCASWKGNVDSLLSSAKIV